MKYTQMAEDLPPSSRMMSGDALQRGLQEYQTASFVPERRESIRCLALDELALGLG